VRSIVQRPEGTAETPSDIEEERVDARGLKMQHKEKK